MKSFDKLNSTDDILSIVNSAEFKQLWNVLGSEEFGAGIEEDLSKPQNKTEIYEEIVSYYLMLLSLLKMDYFHSFCFPDHENCRTVTVDGITYDFDSEFCHDDIDATDALCAIDCLMADFGEDTPEKILKKVERKINKRIQKQDV